MKKKPRFSVNIIMAILAITFLINLFFESASMARNNQCEPIFLQNENLIIEFLDSQTPDYSKIESQIFELETKDTSDPVIKNQHKILHQKLNFKAQSVLKVLKFDLAKQSLESLQILTNKLRLLNTPSIRNFLTPDNQELVAKSLWLIREVLWNDQLGNQKKIELLGQKLFNLKKTDKKYKFEALELLPSWVGFKVKSDDIFNIKTDAVVVSIGCDGLCDSRMHQGLPATIRKDIKAQQWASGQARSYRDFKDSTGNSKNYILIVDDRKSKLHQLVLTSLVEAETDGFSSVALPIMRTGDNFGVVESSLEQIKYEILKGISLFYQQSNGGLKEISLVSPFSSLFSIDLLKSLNTLKKPRERSLRYDMRDSDLSGKGFTMAPSINRQVVVDQSKSPIYQSLFLPWNLSHMMDIHAPVKIEMISDKATFNRPVLSVLNMPIKMPGTDFRVPVELEQFREFLQKMIDHEVEINPYLRDYYAYFTVDQSLAKKGTTQRRSGIHIDGVQGSRYPIKLPPEHTYSCSDSIGTVFYNQVFDLRELDPGQHHVHAELERQARPENRVFAEDFGIYFWDSYSVHEANTVPRDLVRTFLRVEFSKKIYDGVGDTHNPLFEYHWPQIERSIPENLVDFSK